MLKNLVLVFSLFLSSCAEIYGVEESQAIDWVKTNSNVLTRLVELGLKAEVNGSFRPKENITTMQGLFYSAKEEQEMIGITKDVLARADFPDTLLTFNLERNNDYKTIYLTLYLEGFCAAFSDCYTRYVVYCHDEQSLIKDKAYNYTKTDVKGWYILTKTSS